MDKARESPPTQANPLTPCLKPNAEAEHTPVGSVCGRGDDEPMKGQEWEGKIEAAYEDHTNALCDGLQKI